MRMILISLENDVGCNNLRLLSSYLKENGHKTFILNIPLENKQEKTLRFTGPGIGLIEDDKEFSEIVDFIKRKRPNLVGFSLMSPFLKRAIRLTKEIKKLGIMTIWGGIHPSVEPINCLKYADAVCLWEGEEPLLDLANYLDAGKNPSKIKNLWFNNNGKIIKNPLRPLVSNIDKYPFPDYELETNFVLHKGRIRKMTEELLKNFTIHYSRYYDMRTDIKTKFFEGVVYRIITSRGCPFSCSYCCNNIIRDAYGNVPIRKRSVDSIIGELASITKRFNFINFIKISDDNFFVHDKKWYEDFCEQYKEKINLPLGCLITPSLLNKENKEIFYMLIDAGLAIINMGIEGTERSCKKYYHRYQTNEQVLEAARFFSMFKDKVISLYDIIVDNPWETEEDLKNLLNLLLKLPKYYTLSIYSLTFFPGTYIYKKALQEGIINENYTGYCDKHYLSFNFNNKYNLLIASVPFLPSHLVKFLENNDNFFTRIFLLLLVKNRYKIEMFGGKVLSNKMMREIINYFLQKTEHPNHRVLEPAKLI